MEGKAVLFKRFADVDSIDLEVDTTDAQQFIEAVELLGPSFGGINLEDIAAPDCFIIEQALKERMNIPVFHDDQHGTAIITAAGLINACFLTGREFKDIKVVVNGAGAAAIACTELIKAMGVPHDNVIMCDRKGPLYPGRGDMDQFKSAHAVPTEARSLKEALVGADVFLGLSAAGALKPDMVEAMAPQPIIFAMANPGPGDYPAGSQEGAARRDRRHRPVGLSQPGQQCPRLPVHLPRRARRPCDRHQRGDEDRRRTCAGRAGARGGAGRSGGRLWRGQPPLRSRLHHPGAVRPAADRDRALRGGRRQRCEPGVAQKPIADMAAYRQTLRARLNPTASILSLAYEAARANPKRVLFAEGEEENVLRAAIAFREGGYGTPVLVGREDVYDKLAELGSRRSPEL